MVLYENSLGQLKKDIQSKKLVDYIVSEFEQKTGSQIQLSKSYAIKYLMQILLDDILLKSANPDCGIRLSFKEGLHSGQVRIMFASEAEGHFRFCTVGVYSGSSVCLSSPQDCVEFKERDQKWTDLHPSKQSSETVKSLSAGISPEDIQNVSLKSCSFLFDCVYSEEKDIISAFCDQEALRESPVFYANDIQDLDGYLSDTISGGNAEKALKKLREIEWSRSESGSETFSEDQSYLVSSIVYNVLKGKKSWFFLEGQTGTGKSRIVTDAINKLLAENKHAARLKGGEKPEAQPDLVVVGQKAGGTLDQMDYAPVSVYTCDNFYADLDKSFIKESEMKTAAEKKNIPLYVVHLKQNFGFRDGGRGMHWLLNLLQIASFSAAGYNPAIYSIEASTQEKTFSSKDKIAVVRLTDAAYDPSSNKVVISDEEKVNFYSQLSKGPNGVYIVCPNTELTEFINWNVRTIRRRFRWADEFVQSALVAPENNGLTRVEEQLQEDDDFSSSYEKYLKELMGDIGWSRLSNNSRIWLKSSLMAFDYLTDHQNGMDFSGVCVQIGKACELELVYRIYEQFVIFLNEKYGMDLSKYPEECLETFNERIRLVGPNKKSLGGLRFVIGLDANGNVISEQQWKEFEEYARTELMVNPENVKDQLVEQIRVITKITKDYRNRSAHKEYISIIDAKECIEYVLSVSKKLAKLLESYRF